MTHPTELLREFAPRGALRAALNHGNRVLAGRDAEGRPAGISVDLARALADHLGLEPTFVEYDRAVDVSSSATEDAWDVCFLAVDPDRARTIAFTEPYIRIEGCYLAGARCPAVDASELVASGARVATVEGSAYTLALRRLPGAENLATCENAADALRALDTGEVQAVAGIRAAMEEAAAKRPGSRILTPPFMEIRHAMAMPRGRPAASRALSDFLSGLARSGRVGDILEAHGVDRNCAIIPS